ncbi:MAG: dynamin family protein [Acidobacteriota bacterium]|nr:dynamin family protein [Acidobacteriota bacterium]
MDWNTAAAFYLARLPRVFDVQKHALSLVQLPQTRVSEELRQALIKPVESLHRQYERLRKNEFRIAVVGLEKAGKSTFVNAWLGVDLLPNEQKRCTYTPTQIFSVQQDSEQRLEIIPRSQEQMRQFICDLEVRAQEKGEAGQRARADLDTIRKHRISLEQVVNDGPQRITFTRLEEITEPLRKYVADESHAHAVLEARLYTSRLASAGGIVFYDVPGLNSGLGKHVEDSEQMLKDCDAVILIQRSKQPSLDAYEQKLIQFIHDGDEVVGLAGKLFVFFGRIDEQGTPESLQQARNEALRDWQTRGQLPPDRLIPGSAAAYLLLIHRAGTNLQRDTGGPDIVLRNLQRITGASDEESLKRASGIPVIQDRINHYLQHERVEVLHRRCREPMRMLLSTARQIYEQVRQQFPEDPEEAKRAEDNRRTIEFSRWWEGRWITIRAELNRYLDEKLLRPNSPVSTSNERAIDVFRRRYRQLIEEQMRALPSRQAAVFQELVDAYSRPEPDPTKVNLEWRERLSKEVRCLIDRVSRELSLELTKDVEALVDRMTTLLWGSQEVRARLHEERPQLQSELKGKLQTLFLRFSRPVVAVLIQSPLASVNRHAQIKRLEADIELLDNYYPEDQEPAYKQLKLFARHGRELLTNKHLRRKLLGITDDSSTTGGMEYSSEIRESQVLDEVRCEVEADLEALKVYLLEAVYAAAGFEAYYEEELRNFRDWFFDQKGTWSGVARNEYLAANPTLLRELPRELSGQTYDTEVSERLRQLRIALEAAEGRTNHS